MAEFEFDPPNLPILKKKTSSTSTYHSTDHLPRHTPLFCLQGFLPIFRGDMNTNLDEEDLFPSQTARQTVATSRFENVRRTGQMMQGRKRSPPGGYSQVEEDSREAKRHKRLGRTTTPAQRRGVGVVMTQLDNSEEPGGLLLASLHAYDVDRLVGEGTLEGTSVAGAIQYSQHQSPSPGTSSATSSTVEGELEGEAGPVLVLLNTRKGKSEEGTFCLVCAGGCASVSRTLEGEEARKAIDGAVQTAKRNCGTSWSFERPTGAWSAASGSEFISALDPVVLQDVTHHLLREHPASFARLQSFVEMSTGVSPGSLPSSLIAASSTANRRASGVGGGGARGGAGGGVRGVAGGVVRDSFGQWSEEGLDDDVEGDDMGVEEAVEEEGGPGWVSGGEDVFEFCESDDGLEGLIDSCDDDLDDEGWDGIGTVGAVPYKTAVWSSNEEIASGGSGADPGVTSGALQALLRLRLWGRGWCDERRLVDANVIPLRYSGTQGRRSGEVWDVNAEEQLARERLTFGELSLLETFVVSGFPSPKAYECARSSHDAFMIHTDQWTMPARDRLKLLWSPYLSLTGRGSGRVGEAGQRAVLFSTTMSDAARRFAHCWEAAPLSITELGPLGDVASLIGDTDRVRELIEIHVRARSLVAESANGTSLSMESSFSSLSDGLWILQSMSSLPSPTTTPTCATVCGGESMVLPLSFYSDGTPLSSARGGFSAHPLMVRLSHLYGSNDYALLGYIGSVRSLAPFKNSSKVLGEQRRVHTQQQVAYVYNKINHLARRGIVVSVDGADVTLYPRISSVVGDNPEQHVLTGVVDGKRNGKAPCVGCMASGAEYCLDGAALRAKARIYRSAYRSASDHYLGNLFATAQGALEVTEGSARWSAEGAVGGGSVHTSRELQLLAVLGDLSVFRPRTEVDMASVYEEVSRGVSGGVAKVGLAMPRPDAVASGELALFVDFYQAHTCCDGLHSLDLGVGMYLAKIMFAMVEKLAFRAMRGNRNSAVDNGRKARDVLSANFAAIGGSTGKDEVLLGRVFELLSSGHTLKGNEYRRILECASLALDDLKLDTICTPKLDSHHYSDDIEECVAGLAVIRKALKVYLRFRKGVGALEHTLETVYRLQADACRLLACLHDLNPYVQAWWACASSTSQSRTLYGALPLSLSNVPRNLLTIKSHMVLHFAPQILLTGCLRGLSTEGGERALVGYAKRPWRQISGRTAGRGVSLTARSTRGRAISMETRGTQLMEAVAASSVQKVASEDGSAEVIRGWMKDLRARRPNVDSNSTLSQLELVSLSDCLVVSREKGRTGVEDEDGDGDVGQDVDVPTNLPGDEGGTEGGSPLRPGSTAGSGVVSGVRASRGLTGRRLEDWEGDFDRLFAIPDGSVSSLLGLDVVSGVSGEASRGFLMIDRGLLLHSISWARTVHSAEVLVSVCHALEHVSHLAALLADRSWLWRLGVVSVAEVSNQVRRWDAVVSEVATELSHTGYRHGEARLLAAHTAGNLISGVAARRGRGIHGLSVEQIVEPSQRASPAGGSEGGVICGVVSPFTAPLFLARAHLFPKLCRALGLELNTRSDLVRLGALGVRVHRSCHLDSRFGSSRGQRVVCDGLLWAKRTVIADGVVCARGGNTGRRDAIAWRTETEDRLRFGRLFAILSIRIPSSELGGTGEDVAVVVFVIEQMRSMYGIPKPTTGSMSQIPDSEFADLTRSFTQTMMNAYGMYPLHTDSLKPKASFLVFGHPKIDAPEFVTPAQIIPDFTGTGDPGRRFVALAKGGDSPMRVPAGGDSISVPQFVFYLGKVDSG